MDPTHPVHDTLLRELRRHLRGIPPEELDRVLDAVARAREAVMAAHGVEVGERLLGVLFDRAARHYVQAYTAGDPEPAVSSGSPAEGGPSEAVPSEARRAAAPTPGEGLVLRAEGLTKRYKKRAVVQGVDLAVRQGEIVGLLGPNGAGKTTTFHMIVGLVRPNRGRIFLQEADITRLPMYRRARRGIGYLAQEASVFRHLTVEQNLHAVLEFQPISRAERRARVEQLLDEFGLARVRTSKGYMLSGGERRRTEIARALATRPRFLLLDEPFAGVDPIAVEDIQAIVADLKARGIGVLITDHNVHETLAITDRAYLLYEGTIFQHGTAEELAGNPEVRRRYLGEKFTLERYR